MRRGMRLRAMVSFAGQAEAIAPVPLEPTSDQIIGWWRADDLSQAEASDVTSWTDRTGNTGTLIVPPGAIAPTFTASFPNLGNRPAVQFLGGIRQLYKELPANYPAGSDAFSVYVVHDPIFAGTIGTMFGWGQNYSANKRMCFSLFDYTPWFIAGDAYGGGTPGFEASDAPQISSIFSASGALMSDAEIWTNGAPTSMILPGSSNVWDIASPCPEVRMGGLSQETAVAYNGTIAEVIAYRKRHSLSERAQTLAYLSSRYGIAVA